MLLPAAASAAPGDAHRRHEWQGGAAAHHARAAATTNIAVAEVSRMDTPWWAERFAAKGRELREHPPRLVWLGDSITQNWERSSPDAWRNFRPGWDRFYGDRQAADLGFKGDSTCHVLWRIAHGELDGIAPRAVVVLIGANNFGHIHTDADQTYAGIARVLDAVHAKLPEAKVLVLGVLPSIRSAWVTENTRRLDGMLRDGIVAGRPWLTFQDVGGLFERDGRVDADDFIDPRLSPPDPPLHPTAPQQDRIAAAIEPWVSAALGDRRHG
ncbi:MAG: acetylhydrolase [Gluconacetobacter diazotrophicus]|nr:acetylhydrolase [Gluconacetobacter diazotrophicus]